MAYSGAWWDLRTLVGATVAEDLLVMYLHENFHIKLLHPSFSVPEKIIQVDDTIYF
jgi:hypothetical protein